MEPGLAIVFTPMMTDTPDDREDKPMANPKPNRRQFLKAATTVAVGTTLAPSRSRAATTGKKFIVGMMGTGGRGTWLLEKELAKRLVKPTR